MDALALIPANTVSLETLTYAFNQGFTDYYVPLAQTRESLSAMMEINDVSLADSLVALDPAGEPAGIALLALRPPRGWVAGMGIAPAWRGKGQGEALMRRLIGTSRSLGLNHLQLEVLEQNAPARHLYERLQFVERRHLLIFNGRLMLPSMPTAARAGLTIGATDPLDALAQFEALHVATPSWQRERPSLVRMAPRLKGLGLSPQIGGLVAYVLFNDLGNGVALLDAGASAPTAGERTAQVEVLLHTLMAGRQSVPVRAINVSPGDPLLDALGALRCPVEGGQWEMTLDLGEH